MKRILFNLTRFVTKKKQQRNERFIDHNNQLAFKQFSIINATAIILSTLFSHLFSSMIILLQFSDKIQESLFILN